MPDILHSLLLKGQLPLSKDQAWKMSGGIEQEFFRLFLLRAGVQKEIQNNMDSPWKITGGFGLKISRISLDGSYEYNTLRVFDVMNVSLAIRF